MKRCTEMFMVIVICLLLLTPACKKTNEAQKAAGSEAGQTSAFNLKADDMNFEVERTDAGEAEAPWARGISATRYDSRLLKTKDGFDFNDDFITAFGGELETLMSEYTIERAESYSELGWQCFNKTGGREIVSIKFAEPLQWYGGASGRIQSSTQVNIMKSDVTSLFSSKRKAFRDA